ncbi:hypothetical protein Tel_08350 [Candidatus Tenderia electrophaga]|uniref:DUF1439 domain-containing protein n=1 Tax=Candidatus Tenderia electrophaga TaxID=1748243 RepID=A0A0S2TDJ6_9GAMM|nr:hypothetical protein Tel_08350 [Candidatus Tenderia electrophaga]
MLLCGASLSAHAYTLEFNRAELQQYVVDYFPLSQQTPFSRVTYSNPSVMLDEKTNRIGLEVTVRAEMPGMMAIAGRGQIDGDLEYRKETHQFYLHDPQINNIRFANADRQLTGTVQQMLSSISQQSLPMILVYELKDTELREKMARGVLKKVAVKRGKLYVDVDLPF